MFDIIIMILMMFLFSGSPKLLLVLVRAFVQPWAGRYQMEDEWQHRESELARSREQLLSSEPLLVPHPIRLQSKI